MTKILAIIPARGGSKRIERKNIKNFHNNPIISYSIEATLKSNIFDEVMVSTNDDEIALISERYGAKIPFKRSEKNSSDHATTMDVIIETINKYKDLGKSFDYFCCIYPTAPFVTSDILINAMKTLINESANCVLPVVKYSFPPQRALKIKNSYLEMLYPENYNSRSQDLQPIFHDAGQFYCMKTKVALEEKTLYPKKTLPMIISEKESQDIDNIVDWELAEMKFSNLRRKS